MKKLSKYLIIMILSLGITFSVLPEKINAVQQEIVIEEVNINVKKPVAGEKPSTPLITTANVEFKKHENTDMELGYVWYEKDKITGGYNILSENAVFKDGGAYKLSVDLKPKDGYKFKRSVNFKMTINGKEYLKSDRFIEEYEVDFGHLFVVGDTISKVDIEVSEPIVGEHPKLPVITTPDFYQLTTIPDAKGYYAWSEINEDGSTVKELTSTDVFEKGKRYLLSLRTSPINGKYLNYDSTTVKINGKLTKDEYTSYSPIHLIVVQDYYAKENPTDIKLNYSIKEVVKGKTIQLTPILTPNDAYKNIIWRVGNSSIASVDQNGKVTAKAVGNTYVYAKTANGLEAKCLIRVKPFVNATNIYLNYGSTTIYKGSSIQLTKTLAPANAMNQIYWRVGNSKIATVDANGKVTAKAVGNTYVYAKTSNGKEAKCLIRVSDKFVNAASIKLRYTTKDMYEGSSFYLGGVMTPSNAMNKITYRVGNPNIATVDQNGKVTAKAVGNTYVYAKTSNGKEAKCLIRVSDKFTNATSIKLNYGTKQINKGAIVQFNEIMTPSNATNQITWRVGNQAIASVDASGRVVAKTVGNTYLYAKTSNGLEAKCLIKVI